MQVKDFHGKSVIDSREVAAMVDKQHKNLLRDIDGYIENLEESGELKIEPSDFFIPGTYFSEQNKELPCYLITKKGCDLIAHKLTGRKGVLFTAAYVSAFEEMRSALNAPHHAPEVSPNGIAKLITITRRIMLDGGSSPQDVAKMARDVFRTWNVPVPCPLETVGNTQLSLFAADYLPSLGDAENAG